MKRNKTLPTLLAIIFIGIIWQIISWQIGFPAIFPSLIDLVKQVFTLFLSDNFLITVSTTVLRGTLGFVLVYLWKKKGNSYL
jgi:ABC-type nitrate/sulfonate/bicarbonate transport system permease component